MGIHHNGQIRQGTTLSNASTSIDACTKAGPTSKYISLDRRGAGVLAGHTHHRASDLSMNGSRSAYFGCHVFREGRTEVT